MILYGKYGEHQPLNRQSETYAREGVDLDVSTLADHVGAAAAVLSPLTELIRRHVFDADRVHGDDTTVPVLAPGKTVTGRLWTYVRDVRPFAGPAPPAAVFFYSRNRAGEHPLRHLAGYSGLLQADAYAGFGELYDAKRKPGPITEAACWSHGRRHFCAKRRWRSRRFGASTRSSPSSAGSTASRPATGWRCGGGKPSRSSSISKRGCAPNAPGCHATPQPPRRSITC